jgi:hypothetical protein
MLGVDFVISALFDTSGLRVGGGCARELAMACKRNTIRKKLSSFTGASVM